MLTLAVSGSPYYQPPETFVLDEHSGTEIARLRNDLRAANTEIVSLRATFREERRAITLERAATTFEIRSLREALERQRGDNANNTKKPVSGQDPSHIKSTHHFVSYGPSNCDPRVPSATTSLSPDIPHSSPCHKPSVHATSSADQDNKTATGYISSPISQRYVPLRHVTLAHDTEKSPSATPKSHSHDQQITCTQKISTPTLDRYSPINPHAWDIFTNMILEDRSVLRDQDLAERLSRVIYHTAIAPSKTLSLK